MLRQTLLALLAAFSLAACGKAGKEPVADKAAQREAQRTLLVAPEDLHTLSKQSHASGPVITGSIQPERRADLRAEISAVVLQVLKENGDPVKRGDLLVRLDDTAIRDTLASAEEAARASNQSFEQAERQYQRMKTLQAQGMSSMQALDDAETRRNNAQSDVVAAKARVAGARQQLQRTEVRAPFDGVVSDRKVSVGDTAQVGKELVKVMDPRSMRFEGLVSADKMGEISVGQMVIFRVSGDAQGDFSGKVRRVNATASATTRQVEVLVDFVGSNQPRAAGLYAEGRIASNASQALLLPESSLLRAGDQTAVWRVKGNVLAKVEVRLGERDPRRGDHVLLSGLSEGDQVLRNPGSGLSDGQKVELTGPAAPAGAPASAAASAGK
jgi:RND family efflux transporter MFP subunit